MSKMSNLNAVIKELRRNANSVLELADAIEKEFITSNKDEVPKTKAKPLFDLPVKEEEPKEKKEVTLAEVKAVLLEKNRAGFEEQVHALIKSYDAPKLSAIDKKFYPELLEKAKVIGNA